MSKYLGIHFKKDDDSGIAKINVDNITKTESVVDDDLIDLYFGDADGSATPREYIDYVYWVKLPYPDDDYDTVVEHSGDHNPSATGPTYAIQVMGFLTNESLLPGEASIVLRLYHTDHQAVTRDHTLVNDESTDIVVDVAFNGDGVEDTFILSGNNYAYKPYAFSVDVGTTWMYPTSYQLTWGSNDPDYDDETIHTSTGYFGVKFDTAPESGTGNVIIRYTALYDKAKLITTLKQPSDGSTFKDLRKNIRLLDHGLELI